MQKRKNHITSILAISLWMIGCQHIIAQVNTYSFSQTVEGYALTSQGEQLGSSANAGLMSFLDESNLSGSTTATSGPGIPIGFSFIYNGVVYDRFGVVNSGWICLGRSEYGDQAVDIGQLQYLPLDRSGPSIDTLRARIVAMDANLIGNGTSSSLTFELIGEAPDQVLVVKWKNYRLYQSPGTNNTRINFEIRLNANNHTIDFRYGECTLAGFPGTIASQVGLGGFTTQDFNCRKTSASKDWNATLAGAFSSDYCVLHSTTILPQLGLNFHWGPPSCPPMRQVLADMVTTTTLDLLWNIPIGQDTTDFEYALTASATPPGSGTITGDTTHHFSALIPGNLYYFHIRVRCNSSDVSAWTTFPFYTLCPSSVLPYYEDFETMTPPALPSCVLIQNNNPASQTWETEAWTGINFSNALGIPYEPTLPNDDWVFLPPMDLQLDSTYILSLDYSSYNGFPLLVYAGSFPSPDSMEMQDTFLVPPESGEYAQHYLLYTAPEDGPGYFAFRAMGADLRVDNITVERYTCLPVDSFWVVANDSANVVLAWTPLVSGATYEYAVSSFEQYPPDYVMSTTADSVAFADLLPSRKYFFSIRTSCGGNSFSPWQSFSFETRSGYDDCDHAIMLIPSSTAECDGELYSTHGATSSGIPSSICMGYADDDVWFTFVATSRSHIVSINNICSGGGGGGGTLAPASMPPTCQNLIAEIRGGTCGDTLITCAEIATGPPAGQVVASNLIPDSLYHIRVFGRDTFNTGQNFIMCLGTYPEEPNNSCATAELLPVSTVTCPNSTIHNLAGADVSTIPVSPCAPGPYYDLWYKFIATSTTHLITASFGDGGDGVIDIYGGTCGSLALKACADSTTSGVEEITLTGLTIGETIYVRVFDATGTGQAMDVEVCIKVPVVNDACAGAINIPIVSGITLAHPANGNSFNTSGTGSCSGYYADDDLWYRFTAVNDTQLIIIIPTSPSPMVTPVIELWDGDCNAASLGCSSTGELLATALVPGQEYYFRIYSSLEGSGRGNFRLGITVPPSYYRCSTALPLPVNEGSTCALTTEATLVGAGVKNEVWFSFVATQASMVIEATDTLGFEMALYDTCGGVFLAGEQFIGRLHYTAFIPGETYYLKISVPVFASLDYQYFQVPFELCVMESPAFDDCTAPIMLVPQAYCDVTTFGSTMGATPSLTAGSCHPGESDVWYRFVATAATHQVTIHPGPGIAYVYGEVFQASCTGTSLGCFSNGIYAQDAVIVLDELTIGESYDIRVAVSSPTVATGDFTICISSPPVNDYCLNATVITPSSTSQCNTALPGTLVNATPSLGRINVWYFFTAMNSSMTIKVTPTTPGFDPALKIWNPDTGITLDDCVFTIKTTFDDTHYDYQAEVISISDLVVGDNYYIEVYAGTLSDTTGDFEICLYNPEDHMVIHSATYETYPFDSMVAAGTWNQPVVKVTLNMSGIDFNKTIRQLRFNLSGTTSMSSIRSATLYIDTKVWPFNNDAVLPFSPFGKPGVGIEGQNPAPFLFGAPIVSPSEIIEFNGEFQIKGEKYGGSFAGPDNYQRFLYLVLELACDADTAGVIEAICESITVDEEVLIPLPGNIYPMPITGLDRHDTRQEGRWSDGSTWVCGTPPPLIADYFPVHIYHDVWLDDTAQAGMVSVAFGKSLSLIDGAHLTLGSDSDGAHSGHSDHMMSVGDGSFCVRNSSVDINGAFSFGSASGERYGNGICCADGNGYYELKIGDTVMTRDSTFDSVDYFPFCVEGGIYQGDTSPFQQVDKTIQTDDSKPTLLSLFTKSRGRHVANIPAAINEYAIIELDQASMQDLQAEQPDHFEMQIPLLDGDLRVIQLDRQEEVVSSTIIRSAPDMIVHQTSGSLHYQGRIKGQPNSLVTLSVYGDQIVSMISSDETGDLMISRVDEQGTYLVYRDHQIKQYQQFSCETSDEGAPYTAEQIHYKRTGRSNGDCIQLYLEVDHDIFLDKGGLVATQVYIEALFNQVVALYASEGISLSISEIVIWTGPSPYTGGTMAQLLDQFKSARSVFNGDLGILLSYQFGGGLAQLNGLCRSEQKYSLAYAGIYPDFENVPLYSWSVEVIAHELGHLLGSRHTHACVWNGDHTPLDGCYTAEGGCDPISELPVGGGTIMSYCHLTEAGIQFANGLGLQPGNVMRYQIDQAGCTQSCTGSSCSDNEVTLIFKTDNLPQESTWMIRDSNEQVIYRGGPYVIGNHAYQKSFCLPDGCYSLLVLDSSNPNPGGTFIGINSTITTDWNDGVTMPEKDYFRFLQSSLYTDALRIQIKDPGFFSYNSNNMSNIDLHGSLTLGGGDDEIGASGYVVNIAGLAAGLMVLDSLIADGGYSTVNRHVNSNGNFVACRQVWVKPGAELVGGYGISGNMVNDGLFSGSLNRNLSFCGEMELGHHFTNTTSAQTLSGTGLFRPDVSAPIPASQADNQINMLRVDNTAGGLTLAMPLGIRNTLRIRHGIIHTSSTSLLTLGDSTTTGILSTDPTNTQWWAETPYTGTLAGWDGGFVSGPFRRWFRDSTTLEESLFPIGKGNAFHPADLYFTNTAGGYVTLEYKNQQPGITGLPLADEQNTTIGFVSPDGYWTAISEGVTGMYRIGVDAHGFTHDGVDPITDLAGVRLIKRPSGNVWQLSGSSTMTGPATLSYVGAAGMSTFSDFGIGTECGNVVSAAADGVVGSLRYVLANCIASGDTVKFDTSLSLLLITSDTILLDKSVTIFASSQDNIVIQATGTHSILRVPAQVTATISNVDFVSGTGLDGRSVVNQGTLTLQDVQITDAGAMGSAVLNQGMLLISGQTDIHSP